MPFGFSLGPYMAFPRKLRGFDSRLLQRATYQIVPGPHGGPMAQLDLQFQRRGNVQPVMNPEMSLVVLLDRSGSMDETFSSGHAFDACAAILDEVMLAGGGYDLIFYDDRVSDGGHITNRNQLAAAIRDNGPRGGTTVTPALKYALKHYHKKRGIYLIVITDGEFSDKLQAEQCVRDELLPLVTPDNPYGLRLHFIGAGHGVDREFLERMESLATGQGTPLIAAHHHAHISHAHETMIAEMERTLIGVGAQAAFGAFDHAGKRQDEAHAHAYLRTGDIATRHWSDGAFHEMPFVPRRALLGVEFAPHHPHMLPLGLRYRDGNGQKCYLSLDVPLPKQDTRPNPGSFLGFDWRSALHWPFGQSPEQQAARAEADRQRAALQRLADENHQAELKRQSIDLQALTKGGIPIQAQERLKELGQKADEDGSIFTSNLAPDELALLRRHGFRARGLVTGSAMYHVGQAYASSTSDCEVTVLSEAYNEATRLAVQRLEQELKLLGAHGVVGVRMSLARHEWSEKSIEVQLVGTAIEGPGAMPARPWMSDLSGQEWYALFRAGYEPVGLVWGHCTWFVLTTPSDESRLTDWTNMEMDHWSQALSQARHRALWHVRDLAQSAKAHGVVGVHIERRIDEVRLSGAGDASNREHHNLVLSVIGTAIRLRQDAPERIPATQHVLSLRDGRLKPMVTHTMDLKLL